MKSILLVMTLCLTGLFTTPDMEIAPRTRNYTPAKTVQAYNKLLKNDRANVVRTKAAAIVLIGQLKAKAKEDKAAVIALKKFERTLTFRNGGLSGAKFDMLQGVLTTREIQEIWRDFGMDPMLVSNFEGYYCEGTGTCRVDDDAICTSNC